MFAFRSLNKADRATDLAIPVMAEEGWSGVTLAAIACRGNMRRQSVLTWFGSVDALREQIAWRYARRWSSLQLNSLVRLYGADPDPVDVIQALLPTDDDGIIFARIWLSICDAGRTAPSIAAAAAFGECEQRDRIRRLLGNDDPSVLRTTCALLTGLRSQVCDRDPISPDEARAAAQTLRK